MSVELDSGHRGHMGVGENLEIITYVREGAVTHKDSLGNEGRTEAGDVQVMSARRWYPARRIQPG
jgi:redox-sensitive bicupin YhaK (pirin superfamily)